MDGAQSNQKQSEIINAIDKKMQQGDGYKLGEALANIGVTPSLISKIMDLYDNFKANKHSGSDKTATDAPHAAWQIITDLKIGMFGSSYQYLSDDQITDLRHKLEVYLASDVVDGPESDKLINALYHTSLVSNTIAKFGDAADKAWNQLHQGKKEEPVSQPDYEDDGEPNTFPSNEKITNSAVSIIQKMSVAGLIDTTTIGQQELEYLVKLLKKQLGSGLDYEVLEGEFGEHTDQVAKWIENEQEKLFGQQAQTKTVGDVLDSMGIGPNTWSKFKPTQKDAISSYVTGKLKNPHTQTGQILFGIGLSDSFIHNLVKATQQAILNTTSDQLPDDDEPTAVPSTPVTPQQSQEVLGILSKIANAKYVQEIHNLKNKAFAAGVTPEQWKALLGYLKQNLAAFHNNPYYKGKKKKPKIAGAFDPQEALKAMGMDQAQQPTAHEPPTDKTSKIAPDAFDWSGFMQHAGSEVHPVLQVVADIAPKVNSIQAAYIVNELKQAVQAVLDTPNAPFTAKEHVLDTALDTVKKFFTPDQYTALLSNIRKLSGASDDKSTGVTVDQSKAGIPNPTYKTWLDVIADHDTPTYKILGDVQINDPMGYSDSDLKYIDAFNLADKALKSTNPQEFDAAITQLKKYIGKSDWDKVWSHLYTQTQNNWPKEPTSGPPDWGAEPQTNQEKEVSHKIAQTTAQSILANLGISGLLPKGYDAQKLLSAGTPYLMKALAGPEHMISSHINDFVKAIAFTENLDDYKMQAIFDDVYKDVHAAHQQLHNSPSSQTPSLKSMIPQSAPTLTVDQAQEDLENSILDILGGGINFYTAEKVKKILTAAFNAETPDEATKRFYELLNLIGVTKPEGEQLLKQFGDSRKALGKEWGGQEPNASTQPDDKLASTSPSISTSVQADNLAQVGVNELSNKWNADFSETTEALLQDFISKAIAASDVEQMLSQIDNAASSVPGTIYYDAYDDILDYVKKARKQLQQEKPTGQGQSVAKMMNEPDTTNPDDNVFKYESGLQPYKKLLTALENTGIYLDQLTSDEQQKIADTFQAVDQLPPNEVSIPKLLSMMPFKSTGPQSLAYKMAVELFKQKQQQLATGESSIADTADTVTTPSEEPQLPPAASTTVLQQALDSINVPQPAIKAVNTNMNLDWSKGDPNKIAAWIYNGWKKTKPFETKNRQHQQDMMMALVKYYNYDINKVPQDMLPDAVKQALSAPQTPVTSKPTPTPVPTKTFPPDVIQNNVQHYLDKVNGDVDDALAYVQSLNDFTTNPDLKALLQVVSDELKKKSAAKQDTLLQKEPEPEVDPELEKQHKEESAAEAKDFVSGYLQTAGLDLKKLPVAAQQSLQAATDKALDSQSEFGVIWAFHNLEKAGVIDANILDGLKDTILEKLKQEGTLDTDPNAFKKHFDYQGFLDKFLQDNPAFAMNLSPTDKATLLQAMKVGLNKPSYPDAKAYYNQTLVGKIPGFDETIFQKWRNQLMVMFDEMKNAAAYEQQKKVEKEAKKKEAEAMQTALEQLSKGDLKSKLDAIMTAGGVSSKDQLTLNKTKLAIAKALQASNSDEVLDNLPHFISNKNMVNNLVLSTYFDSKYNLTPKAPYPEPKVHDPIESRIQHVFAKWKKLAGGVTPGHVPAGERTNLVSAVINGITMTDQKAMPGWLAATLASSTSLTDDQIANLVKSVQTERVSPVSLQAGEKPTYTIPTYTTTAGSKSPMTAGPLISDPSFKSYLNYYKINPNNKEVIAALTNTIGAQGIYKGNRPIYVSKLYKQLVSAGVDEATAKKMANWATREAMNGSEMAKKAYVQSQSATSSTTGKAGAPVGTDQQAIKNYIAGLTNVEDPHGIVRGITVKGEQLIVEPKVHITAPEIDGHYSNVDAKQQAAWLKTNLSPELHHAWDKARDDWQGSGQWHKDWKTRKFTNQTVTQVIEGPPPLYAKMPTDKFLERGMKVTVSDFKEYIKAFEVGKKSFIGPSGFSSNTQIPRSYSGIHNVGTDFVPVLLRVRPDSSGKLKGVRLQTYGLGSEHEIIVGTGNNYRCIKVIKHLVPQYGKLVPSYEIELQYEDNTNESVLGIPANNWAGLSRETVKMLLKYNNSNVTNPPGAN
jgi:hypothetical protein